MKWWEIILCVLFNAIWVIPLIFILVIQPLEEHIKLSKKNKEWIRIYGRKLRKKCVECEHCKTFKYHPFYKYGKYGNAFVSKLPSYCKKQKVSLKSNVDLRCTIRDNQLAMYEE